MRKIIVSILIFTLSLIFANEMIFASEKDFGPYQGDYVLSPSGSLFVSKDGKDFLFFHSNNDMFNALEVNGKFRIVWGGNSSNAQILPNSGGLVFMTITKERYTNINTAYIRSNISGLLGDLICIEYTNNIGGCNTIWNSDMKKYTGITIPDSIGGEGYEFWHKKDGKTYINLDGKDYGPMQDDNSFYAGGMLFSLKITNEYGRFSNETKSSIVLGKKIFGPYSNIWNPRISMNRKGFGFIGHNLNGANFVNVNGKAFGPYYGNTPELALSGNGKKYIFIYTKGGLNPQVYPGQAVNINGMVVDYEIIEQPRISFDGTNYAFVFYKQGKRYVNINGKAFGPYEFDWNRSGNMNDELGFKTLVLSSNGKGFVYSFERDGKIFLNVNGKIIGPYNSIRNAYISSDGKSVGYIHGKEKKMFANINGTNYGPYYSVGALKYSSNGETWAFTYRNTESANMTSTYVKIVRPNE